MKIISTWNSRQPCLVCLLRAWTGCWKSLYWTLFFIKHCDVMSLAIVVLATQIQVYLGTYVRYIFERRRSSISEFEYCLSTVNEYIVFTRVLNFENAYMFVCLSTNFLETVSLYRNDHFKFRFRFFSIFNLVRKILNGNLKLWRLQSRIRLID